MNGWKIGFLVLVVIAIVAVAYGAFLIRHGFSARGQPSALETAVARTVRDLAIPPSVLSHK
jgi:hypothetical protein